MSTTTASFAPASIAVSYACRKNPRSARVPSTPKYATVIPLPEANETASRIRSSIDSRDTPSAASFASEIGDSITLAPTPSSTSASTSAATAREKPQTSASSPAFGDQLHGLPVVRRRAREAGLDPLDAECVDRACELELLLRVEHDADGLLAVPERRVVEADRAADPGLRR